MPQEIALHGVLVPAAAGIGLLIVLLIADAVLRSRARHRVGGRSHHVIAWLHARLGGAVVMAPALALVFALSFHARQGLAWPPPTAWEWAAPAVLVVAAIAWFLPAGIAWIAAVAAGALTAWALSLPGFKDPSWRIGIGAAVLVLALALHFLWGRIRSDRDDRATRGSELLALSAAFAGLAGVVIASGFEKLTTNMAALAVALAAAAVLAFFHRSLRIGSAGGVIAAMLLVAGAAIAAAYGSDVFPFWHWPVAIAAPLAAVAAEARVHVLSNRSGVRAAVRVAAVALIAFGNAAMALAPLIARGEFPPK